jgi:hypothetical protein
MKDREKKKLKGKSSHYKATYICTWIESILSAHVRVANFFLIQYTNMGENIPNYHKIDKWTLMVPTTKWP